MSVVGEAEQRATTPPLPKSMWVLAWSSLAGQAVWLIEAEVRLGDEVSLVGSVVLGALLFGYVSAGVVRARTVRLVLAWVVLALVMSGEIVDLVSVEDVRQGTLAVLSFATAALAVSGLAMFHRTDWFAWQRTKPPANQGARIGTVVATGVLVGVMGGLVAPTVDTGPDVPVGTAPAP